MQTIAYLTSKANPQATEKAEKLHCLSSEARSRCRQAGYAQKSAEIPSESHKRLTVCIETAQIPCRNADKLCKPFIDYIGFTVYAKAVKLEAFAA